MATRATYQIDSKIFYIHWDGYPEGAADYFAAMEKAKDVRDLPAAERFQMANPQAEPIDSHERHSDTQYRYTYVSDVPYIKCDEREIGGKIWKCLGYAPIHEFIAKTWMAL